MKHNFMNKENGKVATVLAMYLDDDGHMQTDHYDKVEDLMEDYAAYTPAEPLLKDEKIRNLVKNFALYTNATWIQYESTGVRGEFWTEGGFIANKDWKELKGLINHKCYTIAELCGEEEE